MKTDIDAVPVLLIEKAKLALKFLKESLIEVEKDLNSKEIRELGAAIWIIKNLSRTFYKSICEIKEHNENIDKGLN